MKLLANGWVRLWIVVSVAWMVGYVYVNNWDVQTAWEIGGWSQDALPSCYEAPESQMCKDDTAEVRKSNANQRWQHLQKLFGPPALILVLGLAGVWVVRGFKWGKQ